MLGSDYLGRLRAGAEELGVSLSDVQIAQFARFGEMLEEWNRRLNLTRVPPEDYLTLHYLDSLAAANAFPFAESKSLIDVGSGAGLPGIPLKIAYPHLRVALLDATRKRLAFLDAVIHDLGLAGIRTVHARAEDASRDPDHRERYDAAIARAVARMPILVGWLLPFVRPGGTAIALKSAGSEEEIAESAAITRRFGAAAPETVRVSLPDTDIVRAIVLLRKLPHSHRPSRTP